MKSIALELPEEYAERRTEETRKPYLVSVMGKSMLVDSNNLRVLDEIGDAVARIFRPSRKRPALILASLLLSASAHAADKPPAKPRIQPIRTVSVRLMPAGTVAEPWKITTNTAKSCSVQVDEPGQMAPAFAACMSAKPEADGCRNLSVRFMNQGKWDTLRVRAVVAQNGTWTKDGCDQSKVKGGAK